MKNPHPPPLNRGSRSPSGVLLPPTDYVTFTTHTVLFVLLKSHYYAQSPHKWWSTLKSAVFGLSSSQPPLVGGGGELVRESVGKADLLSDHFDGKQSKESWPATHLPPVSLSYLLCLQVEWGQASLVRLGPLWGLWPIGYVSSFLSPSLWEAALETERRCFSKVIFESNVTPKIARSSDYFSTVPPIVNGGDWGCIVRDLETIIVLVLLAFNFIPQRPHHSLTLPRSRIRDSATVTLTPGDGTTAIKVESSA